MKNKPEAWKVKGFMFCALLANSGVNFPGYFNSRETGIPLFPNRSPLPVPNVTSHLQIVHTAEKSFACLKCDKTFSWSGTLKEHERLHLPVPNVTSHLQIVVI